jgi:hypothetical protein
VTIRVFQPADATTPLLTLGPVDPVPKENRDPSKNQSLAGIAGRVRRQLDVASSLPRPDLYLRSSPRAYPIFRGPALNLTRKHNREKIA